MIYGDRLMTILSEEVLARVPSVVRKTIKTPIGSYEGLNDEGMLLCIVSIIRCGEILLESIRKLEPGIRVGKILIQRDEESERKHPIFFYEKLQLPSDITIVKALSYLLIQRYKVFLKTNETSACKKLDSLYIMRRKSIIKPQVKSS